MGWRQLSVCIVLLLASSAWAATWNEPWQDEVLRKADAVVKAEVLANDGKSVSLKVVKTLAGDEVPEKATIDGFSLLRLGSRTVGAGDDELEFHFKKGSTCYFFLTKQKDGKSWAIATPTTGFAAVVDGNVTATYRHSYHQALVTEDLYETTMKAMFLKTHGKKVDSDALRKTLLPIIKRDPQPAPKDAKDKDTAKRFFEQHAALETLAYFSRAEDLKLLEPFLKCDDFHVQISAVRALGGLDSREARDRLIGFLEGDGKGFAKVMAVWEFKRQNAREYLPKLKELQGKAPEDHVGFKGNLMDPRVGTRFPESLKAALDDVVTEWSKPETPAKPKPEPPDRSKEK